MNGLLSFDEGTLVQYQYQNSLNLTFNVKFQNVLIPTCSHGSAGTKAQLEPREIKPYQDEKEWSKIFLSRNERGI